MIRPMHKFKANVNWHHAMRTSAVSRFRRNEQKLTNRIWTSVLGNLAHHFATSTVLYCNFEQSVELTLSPNSDAQN